MILNTVLIITIATIVVWFGVVAMIGIISLFLPIVWSTVVLLTKFVGIGLLVLIIVGLIFSVIRK